MLFLLGTALVPLIAAGTPRPYCNATTGTSTSTGTEGDTLLRIYSCNYEVPLSETHKLKCPSSKDGDDFVYKCTLTDAENDGTLCDETYFVATGRRELRCPYTVDRPEFKDCEPIPNPGISVYNCPWNPYALEVADPAPVHRRTNDVPYCNITKGLEDEAYRIHSCNYQWASPDGEEPMCPETQFHRCPIAKGDELHCDTAYVVGTYRRELYCDRELNLPETVNCELTEQLGLFIYECPWDPYSNEA